MAECKDCLSCKVCYRTQVEGIPECTEARDCPHFKDQTRFVEIPSTTLPINVYLVDDIDNTYILRDYFYLHNKADSGKFMMAIFCIETHKYLNYELCEYGKTVFLTRGEARKALNEGYKSNGK